MNNKYRPFDWKDFLKRLAVIAIPVALQNLLTTTASMVDTMMVAPLGELSVGALGLCAQYSSLMFSGYWGFVGGGCCSSLSTGEPRTKRELIVPMDCYLPAL